MGRPISEARRLLRNIARTAESERLFPAMLTVFGQLKRVFTFTRRCQRCGEEFSYQADSLHKQRYRLCQACYDTPDRYRERRG